MSYTRIHRLLRIVTLVQGQPGWTAKRLAAECGVDERTIFRDMKELEGVGIPISFDSTGAGYRISGDFFLPPVHLTPEEALSLALLCEQVAEPEQIAHLRPAWRAMAKIQNQLPRSIREDVQRVAEKVTIQTAPATPSEGHEDVYERVKSAIAERRALVCRYDSVDGRSGEEEFDFEPYALFFSVRAWYAIGHHSGRGALRCLKLNRFTKVSPTQRPYTVPEDFSVEGYIGNAWRMMRGEVEHDIVVRFKPGFAETVSDTRWHKTQSFEFEPDGSAVFKARVAGLDEVSWWVLSYGPGCVVEQPPELARRVRELAEATVARYDGSDGNAGA
ncbi:MAG TPA: YafY family protein [Phycisphaerales bacterium]|nr:YafY family protein [Phycisphaerales bacterium]